MSKTKPENDKALSCNGISVKEMRFGKMLARHILASGLTQTAIARLAATTQTNVSAIVNGRRQCGLKMADRLADALSLKGQDRIAFLAESKKPKWRGFDHELYGPEAVLYDVLTKALVANGVDPKGMLSVTRLDPHRARHGTAVIVMKDGSIYDFSLSIRRQTMETVPASPEADQEQEESYNVATPEELLRDLGIKPGPQEPAEKPATPETPEPPEPPEPPETPEPSEKPETPETPETPDDTETYPWNITTNGKIDLKKLFR